MASQTLLISFVALVELSLTEVFPIFIFEDLWCIVSQILLLDSLSNYVRKFDHKAHVAVSYLALGLELIFRSVGQAHQLGTNF